MIRTAAATLIVALLAGCSSIDAATRQARRSAAANWGHERDERLNGTSRDIAHVNAVAWDVQYYCLTGFWRNDEARRRCLDAFGVQNEEALVDKLNGVDEMTTPQKESFR